MLARLQQGIVAGLVLLLIARVMERRVRLA